MTPFPIHDDFINSSYERGFERVHTESVPEFLGGFLIIEVFRRLNDETFWKINYFRSENVDGLKSGNYDVVQVEPYVVSETRYRVKQDVQ